MKIFLLTGLLIILSSTTQAKHYNWNYMDIGLNDDGLATGQAYTVAGYLGGNLFARANIIRNQRQTATEPISNLYSFYTAGYQHSFVYVEAGITQLDICWYACGYYSGSLAMLGLAGGSGKLKTKVGVGTLELMEERWSIFEADATYAFSGNMGVYLGIMGLGELGGKVTKLGMRLSW